MPPDLPGAGFPTPTDPPCIVASQAMKRLFGPISERHTLSAWRQSALERPNLLVPIRKPVGVPTS